MPILLRLPSSLALATVLLLCPTGSASAQCPGDDVFAPNHTCQTATPLSGQNGVLTNLSAVTFFEDNFILNVGVNERLTVDTYFAPNGAVDLSVTLFPGGCVNTTPISGGVTPLGRQANYHNTTGAPIPVRIRVDRATGGPQCHPYGLEWRLDRGTCPGDIAEPNDTCATAFPFPPGTSLLFDTTVQPGNDDYYRQPVGPGERVDIELLFPHSVADIDLRILDGCGTVLGTSQSTTNDEFLSYTNNTSAVKDITIRVYWFSAGTSATCNEYDLFAYISAGPCAGDDPFEPNDTCQTALPLPNRPVSDLRCKDGAEDYFFTSVPAGETFFATIDFTHADGDLDLILHSAGCGSTLASSLSVTDGELVQWTNTTGAPAQVILYVDYYPTDGGCNDYDLTAGIGFDNWIFTICEGQPNSTGSPSRIGLDGTPFASNNDARLAVVGLPLGSFGIFVNSLAAGFFQPANSAGTVCINGAGGIGRFNRPGEILQAQNQGTVDLQLNLNSIPRPGGIASVMAGDIWYFQYWHRDIVASGQTSNYSSAIAVRFQ